MAGQDPITTQPAIAGFVGLTSLPIDAPQFLTQADNANIALDGALVPRKGTALLGSFTATPPATVRFAGRDWWVDDLFIYASDPLGDDTPQGLNYFSVGEEPRLLFFTDDGFWVATKTALIFLAGMDYPPPLVVNQPMRVLSNQGVTADGERGAVILTSQGTIRIDNGGQFTRLDNARFVIPSDIYRVNGVAVFDGVWRYIFTEAALA